MTNNEAIEIITHFDKHIIPCDEYGYRIDSDLMEAHLMAANALRNGWIPVSERLPEHGKVVLVYGKRGAIYTAWCNSLYKNPGWHKLNSKSHYCDPTHWMPLPEAPKEVNK